MPAMRLTELVIDLCERGEEGDDPEPNPRVIVYCRIDGVILELEIQGVGAQADGTIVIDCRRPE